MFNFFIITILYITQIEGHSGGMGMPSISFASSSLSIYSDSLLSRFLNISDPIPHLYQTLEAFCAAHNVIGAGCCACVGDCYIFLACCAHNDWLQLKGNTSTIKNESLVLSAAQTLLVRKRIKEEKCEVLIPPSVAKGYKSNSYFMVKTCKENTTAADQEKCVASNYDQTNSFFPVFDESGILYRNEFCAKCNNAKEIMGIGITLKCQYKDKQPRAGCFYSLDTMDLVGTLCFSDKEGNEGKMCRVDHPMYKLCVRYNTSATQEVNYFCKLCEEGYEMPLKTYLEGGCMDLAIRKTSYEWWYCYDLDNEATPYNFCNFQPPCPQFYQKDDNICIKMTQLAIKHELFDNCYLKNDVKLFFKNPNDLRSIKNYLRPFGLPELVVERHDAFSTVIKTKTFINEEIKNIIPSLQSKDEVTIIHPDADSLAFSSAVEFSHVFSKKHLCAKIKNLLTDVDVEITSNCNVTYMGDTIEPDKLLMWTSIGKGIMSRHLSMCSAFYQPLDYCRHRILDSKEVTILTNLSMIRNAEGGERSMYQIEEYVPLVDNKFGICFIEDTVELQSWHSTMLSIQEYLSLYGTLISIIAYILIIVLFCYIKETQSNHHFCILVLCLAFTIEEILYFVLALLKSYDVSLSSAQCKIIGVVNHFTDLFIQFWLCIFTVSVSINVTRNLTETVRIKRSLVMSFLLTFAFVITAFIFTEAQILDARYEDFIGCFLTGFYSRLLLRLVPIVLCIVTSLVFVCSSYWLIRQKKGGVVTLKSQRSASSSERVIANNFSSLIKIVFICGVIDVIAFIRVPDTVLSTPEDSLYVNVVFMLLYAVAKSIRGVLLFIVIVCRREIVAIYQIRFFRAKRMIRVETGLSRVEINVTQDNIELE